MSGKLADDELAITITPNPHLLITLTALAEVAKGFGESLNALSQDAGAPHLIWCVRRIGLDEAGALTIVAGAGEVKTR